MRVGHPAAYPGAYLTPRALLSLPGNPSPPNPLSSLISDDLEEAKLAVVVIVVDPAATGLHSSRQDVEDLRHRRLRRPRLSVGARKDCCLAIARSSPHGCRISSTSAARPATPAPSNHVHELHHYETDAAATQYDYGVDDPSLLPEQPDGGAQDPDATFDDNCYYTEGAYYYMEAADDQE
ncbi:uncharacterized protein LOC119359140 isoform X1 [Triticum dicoccoides]|uniref:uncharacterized protein LOC119359140 isoform X1 n=1 Tax=Triticum dicoccoides TaxID=85692 RepID=UPI00188F3F60|nr:uncharacterized protein LOC119359140 isoform X1 [Triticum dicoccoides]